MFEDFTFDQKEGKQPGGNNPDLDSGLSPMDYPTDWNSLQAAPATLLISLTPRHESDDDGYGSDSIDSITEQLSRQSLLTYHRSNGSSRVAIAPGYSIPGANSTPIPSIPSIRSQPLLARTLDGGIRMATRHDFNISSTRFLHVPGTHLVPDGRKSPKPGMNQEVEQSSLQNPRPVREALVEIMISRGVQCNVQPAKPSTSTFTTQIPALQTDARAAQYNPDLPLQDVNRHQEPIEAIEVDQGWTGNNDDDDDVASRMSLRQAAVPSGIRRANGLRFPSSAEKALRCQGLIHNKIKMRKRPKEKSSAQAQMPTPPPEDTSGTMSV